MKTKRSQEHYMLIDHRNSPGVTREFVAGTGKGGPVVGAGETFEAAVTTCKHCWGSIIRHPSRRRERIWCRKCDAYICDSCALIMKTSGVHKTQWELVNELFAQQLSSKPGET